MELPIELQLEISKRCDQRTKLAWGLTKKEVYEEHRKEFEGREREKMIREVEEMICVFNTKHTKRSKLLQIHKVMRKLMEYEHVMKKEDTRKLRNTTKERIEEWSETGMSKRKCKEYKKFIERCSEADV